MINNRRINSLLLLSASLLVGCSSLQENKTGNLDRTHLNNKVVSSSETTKHALYEQFYEWQNVRYRYGGLSKKGIDCSGFVYLTYKFKLGQELPRTARLQAELGREIGRNELKAGDLVFFKTSITNWHVGIFLEQNKFLHVSTSKGVIISKLDNVYWNSKYMKSIRI
jgi:cell wall-associated NlpC family hydrolase